MDMYQTFYKIGLTSHLEINKQPVALSTPFFLCIEQW